MAVLFLKGSVRQSDSQKERIEHETYIKEYDTLCLHNLVKNMYSQQISIALFPSLFIETCGVLSILNTNPSFLGSFYRVDRLVILFQDTKQCSFKNKDSTSWILPDAHL